MRRNAILTFFFTVALVMGIAGCTADRTVDTAAHDELMEEAARVEEAAMSVLGDGLQKQTMTETVSVPLADTEGNTIVYWVCKTTYYDAAEPTGLNTGAIKSVIDPEKAESGRTCDVGGKPGAIYDKDGRSYLCWTISSEYSLVLEYTPGTVTEADMFKMAESVPANGW